MNADQDLFDPESFGARWFHFLLGVCVGMGAAVCAVLALPK